MDRPELPLRVETQYQSRDETVDYVGVASSTNDLGPPESLGTGHPPKLKQVCHTILFIRDLKFLILYGTLSHLKTLRKFSVF